jgi:hypothetical protein
MNRQKTPEEGGWLEMDSEERSTHWRLINKEGMGRKRANLQILEAREQARLESEARWDRIEAETEEYLRLRANRPYKYGPFVCKNPGCGEDFMAQHHAEKYCSDHCRGWWWRRDRERQAENKVLREAMRAAQKLVDGRVWDDLDDVERFWALKQGCPDHTNNSEFDFEGRHWTHYVEPGAFSNSGKTIKYWDESFSSSCGEYYENPETTRGNEARPNRRARRSYCLATGPITHED